MSEINYCVELPESVFFLSITDQYKRKESSLMAKHYNCTYKSGSSFEGSNTNLKFVTCK